MSALYPSFSECPLNEVFAKRNLPYHNLIAHVCIGEYIFVFTQSIHIHVLTHRHNHLSTLTKTKQTIKQKTALNQLNAKLNFVCLRLLNGSCFEVIDECSVLEEMIPVKGERMYLDDACS